MHKQIAATDISCTAMSVNVNAYPLLVIKTPKSSHTKETCLLHPMLTVALFMHVCATLIGPILRSSLVLVHFLQSDDHSSESVDFEYLSRTSTSCDNIFHTLLYLLTNVSQSGFIQN